MFCFVAYKICRSAKIRLMLNRTDRPENVMHSGMYGGSIKLNALRFWTINRRVCFIISLTAARV